MSIEHVKPTELPASCVYDENLNKLTVRGGLSIPDQVLERYGQTIEILDMSNNGLTTLPEMLCQLPNLRIAFFSNNPLQEVPPQLAACEKLEMVGLKSCGIEEFDDYVLPAGIKGLILTDNRIKTLPDSLGGYEQLQKVMLTGNRLTTLPESMARLANLELVRYAGNRMVDVPNWLKELPSLAWYADSDNEFNVTPSSCELVAEAYRWDTVSLSRIIGESSKNVVYDAILSDGRNVAVKMFGSGITTDGSVDNETRAAIIAGEHPHVVGALGRIVDNPHEKHGLVMTRVPETYKPLGLPPDMITLTRDVYGENVRFSESQVMRIAQSISDALEHLHARGVMHGDVYAHNVLYTDSGDAMLCDFGAATVYDRRSMSDAWREKIDVLGYGRMVEELVSLLEPREAIHGETTASLTNLVRRCTNETPADRPSFSEIHAALTSLAPK